MAYKKVMVAFDGSEGSLRALEHAINQNDLTKDDLTVVTVVSGHASLSNQMVPGQTQPIGSVIYPIHVQAPSTVNDEQAEMVRRQVESEIRSEGEEILADAKELLMKEHVSYKTEVLQGDPAKRLCEHAQVHDYDLMIIGSRGLSGLKKLVLGSVSQKVVQEAICPVLIIK